MRGARFYCNGSAACVGAGDLPGDVHDATGTEQGRAEADRRPRVSFEVQQPIDLEGVMAVADLDPSVWPGLELVSEVPMSVGGLNGDRHRFAMDSHDLTLDAYRRSAHRVPAGIHQSPDYGRAAVVGNRDFFFMGSG